MTHLQLDAAFVDDALEFLKLRRQQPTLEYLNGLIAAFIRKVPWESVSRIIKRAYGAITMSGRHPAPEWTA